MRRALLVGFALGMLGLLVLDSWAARVGVAPGLVPRLDGSAPWIASRALGITAFVSLTSEVVFGLLSSTREADRLMGRPRAMDIHRWLSSVTLALVGVHVLVLVLDTYVRFDLLDLVVPFVSKERPFGVAIGILATYVALAIHASSILRKHVGNKLWRRLHYASFVVFVAVVTHGLVAGSDTGSTSMRFLYVGATSLVAFLAARRIVGRANAIGRPTSSYGDPSRGSPAS